jgi:hypothetical protein
MVNKLIAVTPTEEKEDITDITGTESQPGQPFKLVRGAPN